MAKKFNTISSHYIFRRYFDAQGVPVGTDAAIKRKMEVSDTDYSKRGNNYVLIGLPNCGKTTLGQRAAKELGLKFYDMDRLIMEALGHSASFLTILYGYSDIEAKLFEKLSKKAKRSVIATSGDILSFDRNVPLLKRLGHIFFIDRDPEILLADPGDWEIKHNNDAPVSLNTLLVKSHLDLDYAGIADSRVENHGDEDEGLANLVAAIRGVEGGK
jgi:shikimate kinase